MIQALKQLWSMLATLFAVGEDFAYAAKEISEYTREGAEAFHKEAKLERAKAYQDLEEQLKLAKIE